MATKGCVACAPFKIVFAEVTSVGRRCSAAAVDCTNDFTVAMTCGVEKLPTVLFFSDDGTTTEYEGDRTAEDLNEFVNRSTSSAVRGKGKTNDGPQCGPKRIRRKVARKLIKNPFTKQNIKTTKNHIE